MLEELTEEEATAYFSKNLAIVPLYEIDFTKEAEPYNIGDDMEEGIIELERAREALEKELAVSHRVRPAKLKELNLGTLEEPRNVLVAKDLDVEFKAKLVMVLREYKEVFAWSYEGMKGLNPEFYHHKINLAKDTIPVQQRRYWLNPNNAAVSPSAERLRLSKDGYRRE
jgi:hypothetical protein